MKIKQDIHDGHNVHVNVDTGLNDHLPDLYVEWSPFCLTHCMTHTQCFNDISTVWKQDDVIEESYYLARGYEGTGMT